MYSASYLEAGIRRKKAPICKTEQTCKSLDNPCQCYCSAKGGFRDKQDDDKPVYVKNDKHNIHCYCKEWDRKNFPYAERPVEQE